MVSIVHIAPLKLAVRLRRSGIRPSGRGVYALPVTARFTLTHQWTRELVKWSRQPMAAVYARIPDDEPVLFGRYGGPHAAMTATQAAGLFRGAPEPLGLELIVPRRIAPEEIVRVKPLRAVVGWRHFPGAHGRRPCGCPACVARGEPGGRALRARYEADEL